MKHTKSFVSTIFFSLILAACSLTNSVEPPKQIPNTPSPEGKILVVAGVDSMSAARSAIPSGIEDAKNFAYAAALYTSSFADSDLVVGSYDDSAKTVSFEFAKPASTTDLTLEIFAFQKPAAGETLTPSTTNALLSAKQTTLTVENNTINVGDLKLLPYKPTGATGNVELSVTVPDGHSLEIRNTTDSTTFSCNQSGTTATISASDIPAKAYTLVFLVSKSGATVYAWTETINVFNGMTTNAWMQASGTLSTAAKTISDDTINTAALTTFYVLGASGTWYTSVLGSNPAANDDNSGALMKPLATVQAAIDKVKAANATAAAGTEFTIYVDGTFTAASGENVAKIENKYTPNLTLSIIGLGTSKSVFNGNGTSVVFVRGFNSSTLTNHLDLTFENIKITNGTTSYGTLGGGINAGINDIGSSCGKLTLVNCEISENSATGGGGISYYGYGNPLVLDNCVVTKNTAGYGGGIVSFCGGVTLENGTVIGSKDVTSIPSPSECGKGSTGDGGNLANSSNGGGITMSVKSDNELIIGSDDSSKAKCYISGNCCTNSGGGGGVCLQNGAELQLKSGNYIQYNFASTSTGGGIQIAGASSVTISGIVKGNSSSTNGGGISNANASGTLTLNGAEFYDNYASDGGAIYNSGTLEISSGTRIGADDKENFASNNGGAIYNSGTLTMTGSIIDNNYAENDGGGIYNNVGTVTLSGESIIVDNAASNGAGLYNYGGQVSISDKVHIEENVASGEYGGGIFNECETKIVGGTNTMGNVGKLVIDGTDIYIKENQANVNYGEGGGIYNNNSAEVEIKSGVTIKSNFANRGGGIANEGSLEISGGLIFDNLSDYGNSIYTEGTVNLKDDAQIGGDIFLTKGKNITITGSLTNSNVATITPEKYPGETGYVDTAVLTATSGVTLATEAPKFAVTPDSAGKSWKVNAAGNLEEVASTINLTVDEVVGGNSGLTSMTGNVIVTGAATASNWDTLTNVIYETKDYSGLNIILVLTDDSTIEEIGTVYDYSIGSKVPIFIDCNSLVAITIPSSVKKISAGQFTACSRLDSVTFSNTSGWYYTNAGTKQTIDVSDPTKNATNLKTRDWKDKELQRSSTMETSEAIDVINNASSGANLDLEINLDEANGLAKISDALRKNQDKFQTGGGVSLSINGTSTIDTIGDNLFVSMPFIKEIEISGITEIGSGSFVNSGIASIDFKDEKITKIGEGAFAQCTNLTELVLPEGIEIIEKGAFANCTGIQRIKLPASLLKIGQHAFGGCPNLIQMVFSNPTNWHTTSSSAYNSGIFVDVANPEVASVYFRDTSNTYYSYYWYHLEKMEASDVATQLSNSAVKDQHVSVAVKIDNTNDLSTLTSTLTNTGTQASGVSIIITEDSNLTTIGEYAFNQTQKLVSITLPSTVKTINSRAFYYLQSLESVTISEGTEFIAQTAFYSCTKLSSVIIPASVNKISGGAFSSCSYLSSVTFKNTEGWYSSPTGYFEDDGVSFTVTDPIANGNYFRTGSANYLYRQ